MYVGPQVGSLVDLQLVNRAGAKSTESRCPGRAAWDAPTKCAGASQDKGLYSMKMLCGAPLLVRPLSRTSPTMVPLVNVPEPALQPPL
jgi:hypothetical protein